MNGLFIKQMRRKKTATFLFLLSVILIVTALPIAVGSIQNAQRQIESDITHYARGSYDLLVRPKGIKHPLEEKMGIVPENYIGFGSGGISIGQWEEIKNRQDIEIAAPVASLGYFTGIKTNIALFPPEYDYNRYFMQFYTSDGINEYPLDPEYACMILKYEMANFDYDMLFDHSDLANRCKNTVAMFPMPPTYHLLVGIDPLEEEKLTGISFESINPDLPKYGFGRMLLSDFPNATNSIPIIHVLDSKPQLMAKLSIDELDLTHEEVTEFRKQLNVATEADDNESFQYFINQFYEEEYHTLVNHLKSIKEKSRTEYDLDLSSNINPFNQNEKGLYISKDGEIGNITEELFEQRIGYEIDHNFNDSFLYYRAGLLNYEQSKDQLKIKKIGEKDGIPLYREIEPIGSLFTKDSYNNRELAEKVTFVLDPIGEVEIGGKREELASSPLGIYQFAPVTYIGDGTEEPITIEPTITPGSFVTPPAEGLTNIQSAEIIKGDKPIDAIRVKVAGLTGYTKDAAVKIEQAAEEIRAMGLDVTVVAGASPQKIKVDVEGIGIVEESWTTLGAAGTIVSEWNMTNAILAVMFILVAFIYIFNRMMYWEVYNKPNVLLMYQLGWRQNHIIRLSQKEMIFIVLIGGIISIPLIIISQQAGNKESNLLISFLISVLILISFIYLFIQLKIKGMLKDSEKTRRIKPSRWHSMVGKNLFYFRKHIFPPFIQLAMVALLSSFVYISLSTTAEQTSITLLGEYINIQTDQFSFVLVTIAYIITVITLIESILSLLKMREREIFNFRQIGWKVTHIFQLYIKEVAIWSAGATVLGSVLSILLFAIFYPLQWIVTIVAGISFISLYCFVLLFAGTIILYQLKKRLSSNIINKKESDVTKDGNIVM